jgi:hypothetical protein
MVSLQDTRARRILRVMETISGSRVFKATIIYLEISIEIFTLDRNNKLRDNWENLGTALLKHIKDSLNSQEAIGILFFSDALEKNWEIVVVVKLLDFYLPVDPKLRTMFYGNRQIAPIIESSELRRWDRAHIEGASLGLLRNWLLLCLVGAERFSAKAFTLFNCGYNHQSYFWTYLTNRLY